MSRFNSVVALANDCFHATNPFERKGPFNRKVTRLNDRDLLYHSAIF